MARSRKKADTSDAGNGKAEGGKAAPRRKPKSGGGSAGKTASRKPARKAKAPPPGLLPGWRKIAYWGTVAGLWCLIAVAAVVGYVVLDVTGTEDIRLPQRTTGVTVLAANGDLLAHRGTFRGDEIRLDELPAYLPQAVIATEDRRYYYHFGVDPIGLVRAFYVNFRAGQVTQGGSTITQQLAKNLFLSPDRTIRRKVQEAALALWLELRFTKDEILQLYLNRVYLGAGAYGVDAAAHRYFGKSARALTLPEAAIIAGLLKAPTRYSPARNPRRARARARLVLDSMVDAGYIDAEDRQFALNNPASISGIARLPAVHYVVDWVAELLPGYTGAQKTDLIVETTIDPHLQKLADSAISNWMDEDSARRGAEQAALVMLDTNGAIKAMVGGRSYAQSQFNRAVKARRQPGSAFKPFVYLAALESGATPETVMNDSPVRFGSWSPANYGGKYQGPIPLRTALARSSNVIAARLIRDVGPSSVVRAARRLGVRSKLSGNLSLALGTSEVTPLELTAAYVPFANGGFGVIPYIIHKVRLRDGTVLFRRDGSGPGRIIRPDVLSDLNSMLTEVIRSGTGRAAQLERHRAAGKTGTSQESRDAWFVGYTSSLVTGIWVGNDKARSMDKVTGGNLPARIWHDVMAPAHARLPADGGYVPDEQLEQGAMDRLLSNLVPANENENAPRPGTGRSFWQRIFGDG